MQKNHFLAVALGALLLSACGKSTPPAETQVTEQPAKPEPAVHHDADEEGDRKKVEAAFETIFKAVQSGDKTLYHTFFVYRGSDQQRAWKDYLNVGNAEEKLQADKMWAEMMVMMQGATSYQVKKYFTETESEGTWHLLVVNIKRESGDEENTFAFLQVKGGYAIGDID